MTAEKLKVRAFKDDQIVKEIEVTNPNPRMVERTIRGLEINMNHEDYYVDSSDFDEA